MTNRNRKNMCYKFGSVSDLAKNNKSSFFFSKSANLYCSWRDKKCDFIFQTHYKILGPAENTFFHGHRRLHLGRSDVTQISFVNYPKRGMSAITSFRYDLQFLRTFHLHSPVGRRKYERNKKFAVNIFGCLSHGRKIQTIFTVAATL